MSTVSTFPFGGTHAMPLHAVRQLLRDHPAERSFILGTLLCQYIDDVSGGRLPSGETNRMAETMLRLADWTCLASGWSHGCGLSCQSVRSALTTTYRWSIREATGLDTVEIVSPAARNAFLTDWGNLLEQDAKGESQ